MATLNLMQCDLCGRNFPNDGIVQKIRLAVQGPIVRTRQPLGNKPEDAEAIEASHVDHGKDLGVDDACEECRTAIRDALTELKAKTRKAHG